MKVIRDLLVSESGATLIEYALLISLLALVIVAAAKSFGVALYGMYQKIATALPAA